MNTSVSFRVVSWIDFSRRKDDPRNHTKQLEEILSDSIFYGCGKGTE
ncbi:MAG: hypothetical protein QOI77_2491 [Blastocatellia bacterium]|jgi:hypothetical protein|nr:hypothetical protein [Blastocatellia bacterium]